ncbi:MAG TPA: Panacea domain-containing protein [Candidatus Bathyarchaeia archaeon]|nr:Panacea domain-containing protein [Candidatus Bathyarchaeia archaeon]
MRRKASKKLDNAILYLASNVRFNCLKKIAKLLYFIDFTNYEAKSRSLTGLKYQKYTYGPMPLGYYFLLGDIKKRKLIDIKKEKYAGGEAKNIVPKKEPDLSVFSKDEQNLLISFAEKYKNSTAGELENIAKEEPPYIMVDYQDQIPYHLAFYRNTFGEMDLENESIDS